jgi:hypothetical protein
MEILPQLTQNAQTFAFAAAGCLSMAKALQIREKRRGLDNRTTLRKLFPTEEQDEIIRQIDDLREENRERRKEYIEIRAALGRISDHLGISR